MRPSRVNKKSSLGWEIMPVSEPDEMQLETVQSPELSTSSSDDVVNRLADALSSALRNMPSTSAGRSPMIRGDVVPPFNPDDVNQDIDAWCVKIDEIKNMFGWSEDVTIFNSISKLEGLAAVWYKGLRSVNFTWEEWKEKLRRSFPSKRDYHELLEDMMKRKKRTDETFAQYFYEKQALLNACNITGREAVSCIIGGISDTHIRVGAKAANCNDPESLFDYLRNLNDETTARVPFKKMFSGVCFNCKKPGHVRRLCPNTKKDNNRSSEVQMKHCYYCKEPGHFATSCAKRRKYHETK